MPILGNLLYINDEEVTSNVLWSLSYIADGETQNSRLILENITIKIVVDHILNKNVMIKVPAVRVIGCILGSNEKDVAEILECNALIVLKNLITSENIENSIKKEGCWAISNVTAGPYSQIQQVLDMGIIEILVDIITTSGLDYSVK